jgi:hypothetical protein
VLDDDMSEVSISLLKKNSQSVATLCYIEELLATPKKGPKTGVPQTPTKGGWGFLEGDPPPDPPGCTFRVTPKIKEMELLGPFWTPPRGGVGGQKTPKKGQNQRNFRKIAEISTGCGPQNGGPEGGGCVKPPPGGPKM